MNDVQLVIPMSGIGKRFIDAGYSDPKPLIEVDGKPIIQHVVELFPGVSDIIFICNEKHLAETNMRSILLSIVPNAKIHSVPVNNRRGPVDAVLKISDYIDDNKEVIVSYCDYGTNWNFTEFLNEVRSSNSDGAIACYTGFHPHMLGSDNYAFCRAEKNIVLEVREKQPFTNDKMSEQASNGTYYFKSGSIVKKYFQELVDSNINVNGEFYVSLVYNLLIRDGLKVTTSLIKNMLQWGTPYDLEIYKGWLNCFNNLKTWSNVAKNPSNTTLIMPMAGNGERFSKVGFDVPKPLLEVDDVPMVIRATSFLPKSDNNIFLCHKNHIEQYHIDDTIRKYYNAQIIQVDKTTNGQACTCEIGIKTLNLDNPIFISSCDNGAIYSCEKYNQLVNDDSVDVIVWSFRNNQTLKINPNMYSWLSVNNNSEITNVSTKHFNQIDPLKSHAIIGTFFFRKAKYFLDALNVNYINQKTTNNEYYVDDVIQQNILDGLNVKVFEVDYYIGWGTPGDYLTYNYWKGYFSER